MRVVVGADPYRRRLVRTCDARPYKGNSYTSSALNIAKIKGLNLSHDRECFPLAFYETVNEKYYSCHPVGIHGIPDAVNAEV